ncbi:hypothetical protein ACFV24_25240 [Nocardia fluminea]
MAGDQIQRLAIAQAQMRDSKLVARAALAAATTLVDAALARR